MVNTVECFGKIFWDSVETRGYIALEVIFHGPLTFPYVLQAEALTAFVLDYPFKYACIVNSLGKET